MFDEKNLDNLWSQCEDLHLQPVPREKVLDMIYTLECRAMRCVEWIILEEHPQKEVMAAIARKAAKAAAAQKKAMELTRGRASKKVKVLAMRRKAAAQKKAKVLAMRRKAAEMAAAPAKEEEEVSLLCNETLPNWPMPEWTDTNSLIL